MAAKNIIIFGAGNPGKLGYDVATKSILEGHRVTVFSHKQDLSNIIPVYKNRYFIDYWDYENCLAVFNEYFTKNKEPIDIIWFNQSGGLYPCFPDWQYIPPKSNEYMYTLNSSVIIPHLFIHKSIEHMRPFGKTIFSVTTLGLSISPKDRDGTEGLVGYTGASQFKISMMLGYSKYREKNIIYSVLAPSIKYGTPQGEARYKAHDFPQIYDWIHNHDERSNGRIISAFGHERMRALSTNWVFDEI